MVGRVEGGWEGMRRAEREGLEVREAVGVGGRVGV